MIMADLQDRVRDRLRTVLDPETGRDLLAMGMIYGIQVDEGGHVAVQMTTTTRGCPLADFLRLFSWPYGQLATFATLTRWIHESWPVLALAWLSALFVWRRAEPLESPQTTEPP